MRFRGKKLPVYGDGKMCVTGCYVEDHAKGIDMVRKREDFSRHTTLADHNEKQNIQIIHIILDTLQEMLPEGDPEKKLVSEDLITYVDGQKRT